MAIHRGHDRLWKCQGVAQQAVEQRQEAASVIRAVLDQAEQIDSGRKRRTGADHHHRAHAGVGGGLQLGNDRLPQLDVDGADLTVIEPQHANAVAIFPTIMGRRLN